MDGGPTIDQLQVLYENIQNIKIKEIEFMANIHGVKLKKSRTNNTHVDGEGNEVQIPIFRDPKEYEKMTPEQREAETKKMMAIHKDWSSGKLKV